MQLLMTKDLNDPTEHNLLFSESSAEEDDEPVQKKKKSEDLIFEGSVITAAQAAFLIFQFSLRHHLTTKAISEFMLLISVLLLLGNRVLLRQLEPVHRPCQLL